MKTTLAIAACFLITMGAAFAVGVSSTAKMSARESQRIHRFKQAQEDEES